MLKQLPLALILITQLLKLHLFSGKVSSGSGQEAIGFQQAVAVAVLACLGEYGTRGIFTEFALFMPCECFSCLDQNYVKQGMVFVYIVFFGMLSKLKIYLMLLYQSEVHLGKKMINPIFFVSLWTKPKGRPRTFFFQACWKWNNNLFRFSPCSVKAKVGLLGSA